MRSAFGARLEEAIKMPGNPGSIRKFQELLEETYGDRERFGYSYPTINSYLQDGGAVPTIEWVQAVAGVLNVRTAWLAFGEGAARDEQSQAEEVTDIMAWLTEGRGFASSIISTRGGPIAADIFEEIVRRLIEAQPNEVEETDAEDTKALAERLAWAVSSIHTAFHKKGPSSWRQWQDSTIDLLGSLLRAVPGPGEGHPIARVTATLPRLPERSVQANDGSAG